MLSILSAWTCSALYSFPYPHFVEMEAEAETGERAGTRSHSTHWSLDSTSGLSCSEAHGPDVYTPCLPFTLGGPFSMFPGFQLGWGGRRGKKEGGKPASPQHKVLLPPISFLYPGDTPSVTITASSCPGAGWVVATALAGPCARGSVRRGASLSEPAAER